MSNILLGIAVCLLGGCFIIQQLQIVRLRRDIYKLDGILLNTMRQQDVLIQMIEAVPGNPKVKRAVRISDE